MDLNPKKIAELRALAGLLFERDQASLTAALAQKARAEASVAEAERRRSVQLAPTDTETSTPILALSSWAGSATPARKRAQADLDQSGALVHQRQESARHSLARREATDVLSEKSRAAEKTRTARIEDRQSSNYVPRSPLK